MSWKNPKRVAAAKKAWQTIRRQQNSMSMEEIEQRRVINKQIKEARKAKAEEARQEAMRLLDDLAKGQD